MVYCSTLHLLHHVRRPSKVNLRGEPNCLTSAIENDNTKFGIKTKMTAKMNKCENGDYCSKVRKTKVPSSYLRKSHMTARSSAPLIIGTRICWKTIQRPKPQELENGLRQRMYHIQWFIKLLEDGHLGRFEIGNE